MCHRIRAPCSFNRRCAMSYYGRWHRAMRPRACRLPQREARIDATLGLLGLSRLADAPSARLERRRTTAYCPGDGDCARSAGAAAGRADARTGLSQQRSAGATLRDLRGRGAAIVLVTHDVELIAACADRVVLLGEGEVVTEGPTRTLLHESLIFSSQIGKLFPHADWLTASEAIAGLTRTPVQDRKSML